MFAGLELTKQGTRNGPEGLTEGQYENACTALLNSQR
jgi:hypothetical protein